ncbi:hypothetical protein FQ775_07360 [Nitratireductor mangrovi]|uniref:DNA primase/polymerase bifunctional N-terminal domain-containing protein n=2 Tax=Nitratireductor mangrovi TaxID=2599600 RepID=A0A5B8KXA4_9HYPH|nr:hypothetical protein FQ775_07360 [Nitratireductor mangrovi]
MGATDAFHPRLPAALTAQMAKLFSGGYSLIPLGGADGKRPTVRFRERKRLPLASVLERMAGGGNTTYGIRLDGLLVVDVDTDTPEARDYVERRFGACGYTTRTGRGFHLFFRHRGKRPAPVRLPGIAIDFKMGENEFVVGPLSERPDGIVYQPSGLLAAAEHLPVFMDHFEDTKELGHGRRRVARGGRHLALKREGYRLALTAATFEELAAGLRRYRDTLIEAPEDFPDRRIDSLASWFWEKREAGRLYGRGNSTVSIPRRAIRLLAHQGEPLAFQLYSMLQAAHGHVPSKTFAIVPDGIRNSGLIKAGRSQLYAAIEVLIRTRLIVRVAKGTRNREPHQYRLVPLQELQEEGEGSMLTLVPSAGTGSRNLARKEQAA